MSVVSAAKTRLVGTGNVLAALLPGVNVVYSAPGDIKRELLYAGDAAGPVEIQAMAGGGRVKISEQPSFSLVVRTWKPGQRTTETAETRADAIGDVIIDYIAANWTLSVSGLLKATVTGYDMAGWTDDDGSGAVLTLTVELTSYRT